MDARRTVLFIIPHLGGGGAEHVTAQLARGLSPGSFRVHVAILTSQSASDAVLPPGICVHRLKARHVRTSLFRLLRLAQALKPDLVVSTIFHADLAALLLVPLLPRKTRVVLRHNAVWDGGPRHIRHVMARALYRTVQSRAAEIICQTPAMARQYSQQFGGAVHISILPNPVPVQSVRMIAASNVNPCSNRGPSLLAVGRLSSEKGFDMLLEAFARIYAEMPTARLTILGEGPERNALIQRRNSLGLEEAVHLPGHAAQPAQWLANATLFVCASRFEGLPNALLEAAAAGVPIVSTPANGGLGDWLHGRSGVWLAESISSDSLFMATSHALALLSPGQRFPHAWIEEYDAPRAVLEFERLFLNVLSRGRQ